MKPNILIEFVKPGLLGEQYPTTQAFINELSKHLKLAKICDNNHLRECWTSDEITLSDGTTKNVNTIKTGADLVALAPGTAGTATIVPIRTEFYAPEIKNRCID